MFVKEYPDINPPPPQKKKKTTAFVENRLKEIRRNSNVNNWHYIETEQNPANLITRMFNLQSGIMKKLFLI